MLTTPQQLTLKTAVLADPTLPALTPSNGSALQIADAMNLPSSPAFVVWKSSVSLGDVGKAFNGSELAGLTTGNQSRLQTIAAFFFDGINPSLASNRAFFDDVFSGAGGTSTRAALLSLWKRTANRVEKTLAIGTGSDASPGVLDYQSTITYLDVVQTMGWPY